jgi:hypothetical protein
LAGAVNRTTRVHALAGNGEVIELQNGPHGLNALAVKTSQIEAKPSHMSRAKTLLPNGQ